MPLNPNAYRFDSSVLIQPLIEKTKVRTIAPIEETLQPYQQQYRYETVSEDTELRLQMDQSDRKRSDFELQPTTVNVPVIEGNISYKWAELQRINGSLLPVDARINKLVQKFANAEDRLFFAGDPMYPSNDYKGIADTTNNTTAASTELNTVDVPTARSTLGSQVGEILDNLEDISTFPLFLVITPNVYKNILGKANSSTDRSMLEALNQDLKSYGANTALVSHIFVSKYLGATLDLDGDKITVSNGISNSALLAYDPNHYKIISSPIAKRMDYNDIDGLRVNLDERMLPIFIEQGSIIYGNAVANA